MSYRASMCRVHPWTSRESDATLSSQYDLLGALEVELGHIDLLRDLLVKV